MRRFNIAYLGGHKSAGYPVGVQNGIKNAIEEQGHNLITMADLLPYNFIDDSWYSFRLAFELAARMDIDAYIAPVGIINQYNRKGKESDSHKLVHILPPSKTILLDDAVEGYRSVTKNNKPGMQELMRHLIEVHNFKRICFISGPERSVGARERESVYFEEMAAHNLVVEDKMFARGIFSGKCDEVVEELLMNNPDVEAIACANDHIAMAVYRVLKGHGLTPGVDVAVTGFDDDPLALHATPTLSTVRISAYDVAYQAAYEAVRICEGKEQKVSIINSSFIHRLSCGIEEGDDSKNDIYEEILTSDQPDLDALTEKLLDDTMVTSSPEIREDCRIRMRRIVKKIALILDEKEDVTNEHLIDTKDLVDIFRYDSVSYFSYGKFRDAISSCVKLLKPRVSKERMIWLLEEDVYLHKLIADSMQDEYRGKELSVNEHNWNITQIVSDSLLYSDEPAKAMQYMLQAIREMGVKECYVFEFPEPVEFYKGSIAMNDSLYLVADIIDGKIDVKTKSIACNLQNLVKRFISRDITPAEWLMTNAGFTVGGLLCGHEMLGMMIMGPCLLQSSEVVRMYYQFAFGIKHLQMIRQEKELISILNTNNLALSQASEHDELTGLYNRRGFMHALQRKLNELVRKSHREDSQIVAALYFMDLDGLKQINDNYGHEDGDFAIISTANILKEAFNSEMVGRLGGDEYLGFRVLRESDLDDGSWLIEHINEIMEDFNGYSNKPFRLGISVGYKSFVVTDDTWHRISSFLDEADNMLYENKRARKAKRGEIPR